MTLEEYQQFVLSKAAPPRDLPASYFHLVHVSFGLGTEYLELIMSSTRENTDEELGDFLWYLMLTTYAINYDIATLPRSMPLKDSKPLTIKQLADRLENFLSVCKKQVIYNNPQDAVMHKAFYELWVEYIFHLQSCNFPLQLCISANINKLNERFQSSFSQEEAAARKDKQ